LSLNPIHPTAWAHRFNLCAPALSKAICALIGCGMGTSAVQAQTSEWSAELALSSELTERGAFVGERKPALQGAVTLYDPRGWSAGVVLGIQQAGSRTSRVIVRAAQDWLLSNDWQSQASLQYYAYPGDRASRIFDRAEAGLSFGFRDLGVLGVSLYHYPHTSSDSTPLRWTVDVGARWPLGEQFSLTTAVGHASVKPRGNYSYSSTGLAWHRQAWRLELSYLSTDRRARSLLTSGTPGHWSAALTHSF
jgi:uncharacterized protein (TIGR02001 family)